MMITRVSILSGKTHTFDIPVTQEQLDNWYGGMLVQNAMPSLTPDEREFIMTGSTQDEWDAAFKEDEE